MYKAPPPEVSTEAFYETDPTKPYKRGFSIQCVGPLPITWAEHVVAEGHWGDVLREYMRDYIHWATIGVLCEFLPLADNRVTLADEHDRHGLPVAQFTYSQCDNDKALMQAGRDDDADASCEAAGARGRRHHRTVRPPRRRRSNGPVPRTTGVVDSNLRSFAVPNLYITDGSVLPTQGSANPALTIMALAARCADHLTTANRSIG